MRPILHAIFAYLIGWSIVSSWPASAATESDDERKQACAKPDMRTRVIGDKFCFAIRTYGSQTAGPAPTLVVVLHDDMSKGGPPKHHFDIAKALVAVGIVAVGVIRPGHADDQGRESDGQIIRSDRYSAENVDAIADAATKLKAHHKARETVMIGHSGGAAITGVLIGRHPGLVDRALLISCPCDLSRYRDMRRIPHIGTSLSPSKFMADVPKSTKVIAITGAFDDNTDSSLAEDYIALLKERGVTAKYVVMPGIGHNYNKAMQDSRVFRQALKEIVAGDF